jgi:aspartate dehydrogenase
MTTHKQVGLIGFGAIGRSILKSWSGANVEGHQLAAVLVRPRQLVEAREIVPEGVLVTSEVEAFLQRPLDVAVEVAGHQAVHDLGAAILKKGIQLLVLSVGSLVDESTFSKLKNAAADGGGNLLIPVGAIAGLDGLLALRRSGLLNVKYTSVKPPMSWSGTPAEARFDLARLTERTVIFSGAAREAAAQFPRNANLAATVAFAGLGLDRTQVELVADPGTSRNTGSIDAYGASSRVYVSVSSEASASNPKTSEITGMSVLSSLENRMSLISFI